MQWNWRKVRELVIQQEGTGNRMAAERTLIGLADELEQATDLQADYRAGLGMLLDALQDRLMTGGYWRAGQRYYEQALAIEREVGDRVDEETVLRGLGGLARGQGRPKKAAGYYEQALASLEAIGAVDQANAVRKNLAGSLPNVHSGGGGLSGDMAARASVK
jgi:tetratricopeptide (TPR) repeat protein